MQNVLRHRMESLRIIWVSSPFSINEEVKSQIRDFHRSLFFRFPFCTQLFLFFASASVTLESRYKNEKVDDGLATSERRQLSQVKLGEEN